MARYEKLFDAFGPTAIGQLVAAIVIGALIGFGCSRKYGAAEGIAIVWWTAGGAAFGLVAGLFLVMIDARRKAVAAGTAKPRGAMFWVIVAVICVIVFLAGSIAFIAM